MGGRDVDVAQRALKASVPGQVIQEQAVLGSPWAARIREPDENLSIFL